MTVTLTRAHPRGVVLVLLSLILGIGVVTAEDASAGPPASVSDPIERADAALARAGAHLANDRPGRAVNRLMVVKRQTAHANWAAMRQIGKPPTDPESDDIPGPPAAVAVLALDHRVATGLVALWDGETNGTVIDSIRATLGTTHRRRIALLDKVIALPAEGDFDDYSDLIADRLGMYDQEVAQVSSALEMYVLTPEAREGLTTALSRAEATRAKVQAAFGGGE